MKSSGLAREHFSLYRSSLPGWRMERCRRWSLSSGRRQHSTRGHWQRVGRGSGAPGPCVGLGFCPGEENACKHQYRLAYSSTKAAAVRTVAKSLLQNSLNFSGQLLPHPEQLDAAALCYGVQKGWENTRWKWAAPFGGCLAGCTWLFPLRLKGNNFGAGEKQVGSTICRQLTRTGTACRSARAGVLHFQGKWGTTGTWKKRRIGHGCASASGRLFWGFGGCFCIPQQCRARGRRETRGAGGSSQGYRWARGDVRLGRDFSAWR